MLEFPKAARQILATFICRISFCHHDLHDAPFWKARRNTSHIRFYDSFIPLVFEHDLSFGSVAVIKLSEAQGRIERYRAKREREEKAARERGRQAVR